MNLLLLPGNSSENRTWIETIECSLQVSFARTHVQIYAHWHSKNGVIDIPVELERLGSVISEFVPYSIFAKSAGTLLALQGIQKGILAPERCVFVGIPPEWADLNGSSLSPLLQGYTTPTLVLQHQSDPVGSAEEVRTLFAKTDTTSVQLKELPGNDHFYRGIDVLTKEVKDFCVSV